MTAKHLHNDMYVITSKGKNFYDKLKDEINLVFLEKAPLDNKNSFDSFFVNKLKSAETQWKCEELDDILSLMIQTPLNTKITHNGVDLTFLKFRLIEKNDQIFKYEFVFQVCCKQCREIFKFHQKVTFNAERYDIDPSKFNSKCPTCEFAFHMDSYIANWWMD